MPCNSEYLEASNRETERREAAKVLVFIYQKEGVTVPSTLTKASNDIYGEGHKDVVPELCSLLREKGDDWIEQFAKDNVKHKTTSHQTHPCLLYTSPSPRDS